jgi:carbonic anhydrase
MILKLEELKEIPEKLSDAKLDFDYNLLDNNYKNAVIICADARISPYALANNQIYVVSNAGNVYDSEIGFPKGIENVVVVAHRTDKGCGCGACTESKKVLEMDKETLKKTLNSLPKELVKVATTAKSTPEENVLVVVKELKKKGYKTASVMIHNSTAILSEWDYDDINFKHLKNAIDVANETYRKELHPYALNKFGADFLNKTQTPKILSLTTLSVPLASVFGGNYKSANMIFEAKAHDISDLAIGTMQYAWSHLKKPGSFENSDITVFSAHSKNDLDKIVKRVEDDKILNEYIDNGGILYGLTLEKKGIKFYNIIK